MADKTITVNAYANWISEKPVTNYDGADDLLQAIMAGLDFRATFPDWFNFFESSPSISMDEGTEGSIFAEDIVLKDTGYSKMSVGYLGERESVVQEFMRDLLYDVEMLFMSKGLVFDRQSLNFEIWYENDDGEVVWDEYRYIEQEEKPMKVYGDGKLGAKVMEFSRGDYGPDNFPKAKEVDLGHILTVAEAVGLIESRKDWYGRIKHVGGGRWHDDTGRFIAHTNRHCQIKTKCGREFVPVK